MVKESGYLGLMTKIFLFLIFLVGAIASAYFAMVGLYFGQGVVEVDVIGERYKYACLTNCSDPETATYDTNTTLQSYTDYVAAKTSLNSKVTLFLGALTIVFSLLGLYVLMEVVNEIRAKKKSPKQDMY